MYWCTGVPVCRYTGVPVYRCTCVPVHWRTVSRCTGVLEYRCTGAPVHVLVYRCQSWLTRVILYRCTGVLEYRCTDVPMYQCMGVPMYQCIDIPVDHESRPKEVCAHNVCSEAPASPKTLKMARANIEQKTYEVHLQVTRLERHAIFRKSISLDDVDCFDTLKSQTYQWHEFITLLFQGLRGPFRVVLMRTSCQSRFLCHVIE